MKKNIMISVDLDIFLKVKERGINVSEKCNDALYRAVGDDGLLELKEKDIDNRIDELNAEKLKVADFKVKEEERMKELIQEFIDTTNPKVVDNAIALQYWSKKTGLKTDELIRIREKNDD